MRLRILPVLIAVSVLTLGIRLGEIWRGFGGIAEAQSEAADGAEFVRDPFAQVQLAQAGQGDGQAGQGKETAKDGQSTDGADKAGGSDAPGGAGTSLAAVDPESDPLTMSNEEIELLQRLGERRKALDKRAEELDRREALIKAAQKRLEEKIAKLDALKSTIEDLLVEYDDQQDKQLKRLVNIYEKMKADDAARIFENLEMPVLLKVVDRMNERRTAPILAEMDPEKAQALTLELAERRELPVPRE